MVHVERHRRLASERPWAWISWELGVRAGGNAFESVGEPTDIAERRFNRKVIANKV